MIDQSKPFVVMCMYCQHEPGFEAVDKQVQANMKNFNFSHGVCNRHYEMMIRQLVKDKSPEEAEAFVKQKMDASSKSGNKAPDLKAQPFLAALYARGIFDPKKVERIRQWAKKYGGKIASKAAMTERLQKLAGITT